MRLVDYIKDVGVEKASELLEVSTTQVYRYAALTEIPSPERVRKLKKITHGLVDYEDVYEPFFASQDKDERQLKLKV